MYKSLRAIVLIVSFCVLINAHTQVANAQTKPNVVLIVVDDAGYADFGFQGSTEIPTPNLDALANAGVVFSQGHTGAACSPSRAAFLTGNGHNHWGYEANIKNNDDPLTEHFEGLPNSAVTIFERLKAEGYSTSVAGKWHVGGLDNVVQNGVITVPGNKPPNQGVDQFLGFQAGGGLQQMSLNPDGTNNVQNFSTSKHWSDLWGDTSVDYIDTHYQDPDPFFVYASFNDPHSPITPAPSFNDPRIAHLSGQRKTYASEILSIDDNVGKIIAKLDDPNGDGNTADSIRDETTIIFINDNGGVLGNSADNGNLRGAKGSPYDGGTRVPFFISGAGVDPSAAGTTYDKLVHSIDIVPTVVAAAGGTIPAGELEGVNLLPFINGQDNSNPHQFIAQRIQEEVHYTTNDWKIVKNGYAAEWELFDFSDINNQSEDPSADLAATMPAVLAQMQAELTAWEVTIQKQQFPSTDENISQFNLFDDFHYNGGNNSFSAAGAWDSPTGAAVNMRDRDSHSGTVFHFTADSTSYNATNNLQRMNELEFIANGFTFEGASSAGSGETATVGGMPVLLAANLSDQLPSIKLDATKVGGGDNFGFDLSLETRLFDNLEITGNGDQDFRISGDINEYRAGRTITKTGTAKLSLAGQTTATGGGLVVNGGTVSLEQTGSVTGDVSVGAAAEFEMAGDVVGSVNNTGRFSLLSTDAIISQTQNLTPSLGDGDIDSRNTTTEGDQDSELLIGSVLNATGSTVERVQRALMSFDLSALPAGANITDVAFRVELTSNDSNSSPAVGDLELRELLSDPIFSESGSENVNWLQRDVANGISFTTPGGDLGSLLGSIAEANLPNPTTVTAGQQLNFDLDPAFLSAVQSNLADGVLSLIALLPGEEAGAAAGTGNRTLFRFGSNESSAASAALLIIDYTITGTASNPTISGDFTQTSTGIFDTAIGFNSPTLAVTGNAQLDGDLEVNIDAGFTPQNSDVFVLLDAVTLSGEFANVADNTRVLAADGTGSFLVDYDAIAATVSLIDYQAVDLPAIPGDFNRDGTVDAADYTVWRDNQNSVSNLLADGNGDAKVDLLDYNIWAANYGSSTPPATIPEPTSAVVALIGLVASVVINRRN